MIQVSVGGDRTGPATATRRPSAITCCRFSALKTLPIPAAGVQPTAQVNVSAPGAPLALFRCRSMAGFGCRPRADESGSRRSRMVQILREAEGAREETDELSMPVHLHTTPNEIADAVPDVGVLGDDPKRHLLADARNEHGDLARGRRVELREALLDHGQRGVESAQAAADGAELVAVLVEVALEPAGADAEEVPAARDVVDRPRHVGEQVRVAVRVADHEGAELEEFLDQEVVRYARQLEVYQAADGAARLALYFPLVRAWREWSRRKT